jgi:hypothetical protein
VPAGVVCQPADAYGLTSKELYYLAKALVTLLRL